MIEALNSPKEVEDDPELAALRLSWAATTGMWWRHLARDLIESCNIDERDLHARLNASERALERADCDERRRAVALQALRDIRIDLSTLRRR